MQVWPFPLPPRTSLRKNINGSYKSGISLPENLWVTHSLLTCLDLTVHLSSHNLLWSKDKLGIPFSNSAGYSVPGQDFIIRLSHPDYETAYHKIHIAKNHEDKTLQIRKLTKREKAMMLDEVVVTASVVEFVNKGIPYSSTPTLSSWPKAPC